MTRERISRRDLIRVLALGGGAGLVCSRCNAGFWFGSSAPAEESASGVFRKGGPNDEQWKLWQQRGWVKEAKHYAKFGKNVRCSICPNHCLLEPGDRSHCRNKVNRDGTLFTMAYANPCTFHIDPVEKKPLFHFLPGSRSFSLATSGCVLRCLNCQNWEISQKTPEELKDAHGPELRFRDPSQALTMSDIARITMTPEDVAQVAATLQCPSISYTYSEPVAYFEYAYDAARAAHERKLRNVLVTSGYIEEEGLRDIAQHIDAAHVDLKGFDDGVYKKLNTGKLQPVLNTIKTLRSMGVWVEIINLIVPTYTDNLDTIRSMCDWLAKNAGPDTPLHFSRFHPQHKLTNLAPTPTDTLVKARDLGRAAGLHYVYLGNVQGIADAATTFCPKCKKPVVERDIFTVTNIALKDGKCPGCSTPIAGVWVA